MKWVALSILAVCVAVVGVLAVRSRVEKKAQQRRDIDYQLALNFYNQSLKPGMTRKEVEDYFRARKREFRQMCCVDQSESSVRSSVDDLVKIGEEEHPWFCNEHNVYVAFQFTDAKHHDGARQADDLDVLKRVSIYHWLEGCL